MSERESRFCTLVQEALAPGMNMAWDEALGVAVRRGFLGGFLRFYRWSPPTLSFGYFQKPSRILLPEALANSSLGLVRRASGGKMVFHDQEWTFSCGLPINILKQRQTSASPGGFLGWFKTLLTPLVETLQKLGVPVVFPETRSSSRSDCSTVSPVVVGEHYTAAGRSSVDRVNCFSAAAGHSLMVNGKKLIGAAGLVRDGVLVIHGSLPIARSRSLPPVFAAGVDPEAILETGFLSEFIAPEPIESFPGMVSEQMADFFHLEKLTVLDEEIPVRGLSNIVEKLAQRKYADLEWPARDQREFDDLLDGFSGN